MVAKKLRYTRTQTELTELAARWMANGDETPIERAWVELWGGTEEEAKAQIGINCRLKGPACQRWKMALACARAVILAPGKDADILTAREAAEILTGIARNPIDPQNQMAAIDRICRLAGWGKTNINVHLFGGEEADGGKAAAVANALDKIWSAGGNILPPGQVIELGSGEDTTTEGNYEDEDEGRKEVQTFSPVRPGRPRRP